MNNNREIEKRIQYRELLREIARLKRTIDWQNSIYSVFSKKEQNIAKLAWGDIIRFIFKEELDELRKTAKTPDEIREGHKRLMELPGDYCVLKVETKESAEPDVDIEINVTYFDGFAGGKPVFSEDSYMIFDYKSKAEEIAELCGEGFDVVDISAEAKEERRIEKEKLLKDIFGERKPQEKDDG